MSFKSSASFYEIYYMDSDSEEVFESAIYIKDRFSWWAAIFNFAWFFYHRLWFYGIAILVLLSILASASLNGYVSPEVLAILRVGVFILIGFNAPAWWGSVLERKGYKMLPVVGRDLLDVQRRFAAMICDDGPLDKEGAGEGLV